jgi:hypothetical protein
MYEHPNCISRPHYTHETEQTVTKKFSAPMLVIKDNELVVVAVDRE